jgi:hypothetical protein
MASQKVLINFSDEQIAKLGGCKTAADFQAAVDLVIEESGQPKTEQKVITLEDATKIFGEQAKTFTASTGELGKRIDVIAGDVAKVNPVALVKQAEEAASLTAAKALGKVGAAGAGAVNSDPNNGQQAESPVAKLIASGDYEKAFEASAADSDIRKEFPTAKVYAAYMKAASEGRVNTKSK